jgi:RNA polymerase sigma factor (sigma-70 family)
MLQVKSGDIEQLGVLFERYKKPLFGFFYRSTFNPSLCEDLVQNVFLRLLKYRATFTGNGKFTTWMFGIAHNVFLDNCSKSGRFKNIDDINQDNFISDDNPANTMVEEEQIKILNNSLNKLNREQRELIILSKYQGLKYKEIAEILNCTEGTVKVRVFRALNELKDIYVKLEGSTI